MKRLAFLLLLVTGCGSRDAIDPELAAAVPVDTAALAGLRPEALRDTPLDVLIPRDFHSAPQVLVVSNGRDVAVLAPGRLPAEPRPHGAPDLVARGRALAKDNPVWMVARRGADLLGPWLPDSGNLANLYRLLRSLQDVTLTAVPSSGNVEIRGDCVSPAAARDWSDSVRGLATLSKWNVKDARIRAALDSLQVDNQGRRVLLRATIPLR